MKVLQFIYNENEIDFMSSVENNQVMVNATQMAKIFDKRIDHFLRADHVEAFLNAILSTPFGGNNSILFTPNGGNNSKIISPNEDNNSKLFPPNGGNNFQLNREDIIQTNKRGGTWMHRILALKFAAWLDPYFEVWVYSTIDSILIGHYKAVKDATAEKLLAEIDIDRRKELDKVKGYENARELIALVNEKYDRKDADIKAKFREAQ